MISVCMATFNGEKYLKEQIKSILIQLEINDEIIISDDGSTDCTIEIIKSFNDPRIKLYQNSFKNLISNFEFTLNNASGDYIFLSDQDDIWLPNKVELCMKSLISADLVMTNCKLVDSNLEIIHHSFFKLKKSKKGLINNLIKNSYLGCCMAFKKELLIKVLPFPKKIPMHDLWISFVAECFFKTKFIEEPLVLYRRHGSNLSVTGEKSPFSLFQKICFRFNIIRYCFSSFGIVRSFSRKFSFNKLKK